MQTPLAYLEGRFVPFAEAALPLHDAGFVSGATIVDNARTFQHKLFRWPDHLARFRRDCTACYVLLEMSDEQLTANAEELVSHNAKLLPPGGELQLVTFATPGPLGVYLGEASNGPPTLGMATYPLPFGRYRRFFTEGVTLGVAGIQHSDPNDLVPPKVKHRSRLAWHIAERTVNDPESQFHNPGAVPVILSQNGAGDTAIGSILAVMGNTVVAPVPGVTLDSVSVGVVRELCRTVGVQWHEAPLDLRHFCRPSEADDLAKFLPRVTEFMLAGSGFCLAGVRRFANGSRGRDYPWPGPVFKELLAAWSDLVGVDIARQFTSE